MNANQFEVRLKGIVQKLQAEFGGGEQYPTSGDLVEEILLGILGRDTSESKARDALQRLRRCMVDFNEMRVATPADIVDAVGPNFPDIQGKAYDLTAALSCLYERLETLDLSELKTRPKREADKWLSEVPGIDPYTLRRVMLLCFGGHAVPVNRPALGWMRSEGLFRESVEVPEAQGVLERHVRASDAMKVFCLLQRLAEKAPPVPPARTAGAPARRKGRVAAEKAGSAAMATENRLPKAARGDARPRARRSEGKT
jgi:hypothetical protein